MILQQFYLGCLAHASYLVGDERSGLAAVVDPQRDVDQYLTFAAEHDVRITHVFLTHFHADFLAGHLELRNRVGAAIYLGRAAHAEYAFTPVGDGSIVSLGDVRLRILETPGHTPESISIVVYDAAIDSMMPVAVLTGDTLFVGDVGRPDLRAALGWSAADLGARLFDSLHDKLMLLPDRTLVYPAHGAGSLCGKALSQETVSTIGEQRRANYALRPMSKDAFVDLITTDQPEAPAYFTYDAVLNSRERSTLDRVLERELKPLTLDQVLAEQSRGALLLDTRAPAEFASAHLKGSINIGLAGQYATWAGTLLDPAQPIVIVAYPGAENESAMRLGRIGFDRVVGYLSGGLSAADPRPETIATTLRLSPEVAAAHLASPDRPLMIDVRSPREHDEHQIEGAIHRPLNSWRQRLPDVDRDRPVIVFCAGGYRSSIAASLLQRAGFTNVSELAGGFTAWESAGLPVSSDESKSMRPAS